jgi:hypothetical protein
MESFPWARVANGKLQIESHYPTQAKGRLEWGTQHFLPVWQKNYGALIGLVLRRFATLTSTQQK